MSLFRAERDQKVEGLEHENRKLTDKLQLGKTLEEPVIIKGGLLHKMYRVSTSEAIYAIKRLNPEIMKRKTAVLNMICSEKIARVFAR